MYWCEKYSGTKSKMFFAHWWGRSSFTTAFHFLGRYERTVTCGIDCSALLRVLELGATMIASFAAFQIGRSADESPTY